MTMSVDTKVTDYLDNQVFTKEQFETPQDINAIIPTQMPNHNDTSISEKIESIATTPENSRRKKSRPSELSLDDSFTENSSVNQNVKNGGYTRLPNKNSKLSSADPCESKVKITLIRGKSGYGMNILGGIDKPYLENDSGIFISRIGKKGPAHANGHLAVGDKILSVNGTSCEGMCHSDVLQMFMVSKEKVHLVIQPHAEAYLREMMVVQAKSLKIRGYYSYQATAKIVSKYSFIAFSAWYVLYKMEILDKKLRLQVSVKSVPSKIIDGLGSFFSYLLGRRAIGVEK